MILDFDVQPLFFFLPLWARSVQTKEASQLKLQTSSGEPDESEYGQAKNEEPASRDQSAGKSIKVEPGKKASDPNVED